MQLVVTKMNLREMTAVPVRYKKPLHLTTLQISFVLINLERLNWGEAVVTNL